MGRSRSTNSVNCSIELRFHPDLSPCFFSLLMDFETENAYLIVVDSFIRGLV